MSTPFDPYYQWLGISDSERPPNFYRLLGVERYEDNVEVIGTAADRQMAHVRTFQHGPHSAASQRLLNEIAAAKICLLNPDQKARYDAQLRSQQPPTRPPKPISSLVDEANIPVVVARDTVPLGRPGRGTRRERPWYVSTMFLLPMLGIVLCLVAYRIYRDYRPLASQVSADTAAGVDEPTSEDDADAVSTEPDETDSADRSTTPEARESSPTEVPNRDISATDADRAPAQSAADVPSTPASSPDSSEAELAHPAGSEPLPWNPESLAVTGKPAQFTTSQPMGAFLLALAARDLTTAESVLVALRQNRALGIPQSQFDEAELIRVAMQQFWLAADTARDQLRPGDQLHFGQMTVTVAERAADGHSVQLVAPTGQQQAFDLQRSKVHRDLAIALVERYYSASSLPTAWRLTATFLAIDQAGDVQRAERLAQQAELRGFAALFLTRIVRRLSGDDPSEIPPLSYPTPAAAPPTTTSEQVTRPSDSRTAVPERTDQQTARRGVLSELIAKLREEEVPMTLWPEEMLKQAETRELTEVECYVLLDSALKRARSQRNLPTALEIIDALTRDFQLDRYELQYDLLERTARRVKGDDRRPYAEQAVTLARQAIADHDYDDAVRFAALAQLLARPVSDEVLRRYLVEFRLEIDQMRKAYQTLRQLTADGATDQDNIAIAAARFRMLSHGDFTTSLKDLLTTVAQTEEPALSQLARRELTAPATAEQRLALGEAWQEMAAELTGLERINALRRARHWYESAATNLSREDRLELQAKLDELTSVLGRDSRYLDLTAVTPLATRVGYGRFGVNRNLDVDNPQVEPLPELDGEPISRFLWACAPSRLEYIVPEGATRFRAAGMINAATKDGAQFKVVADGQIVFASPPISVAGGQVPIEVELPGGTKTIELVVDPLRNNALDHAYWIAPVLIF